MKKIYIQILLIIFTISFLGAIAFYYSKGEQFTKISHREVEENKTLITEDNLSETLPVFDEPVLESDIEPERIDPEIEEIVLENTEVTELVEEDQEEINIIEENIKNNIADTRAKVADSPYDLYKDDSIEKFVGSEVPFFDLGYIPEDLVGFASSYVVDTKGNGEVRREVAQQLEKLSESFYAEFGEKIVVVSSYRSYLYQKGIKDRGCPDNLCAKAGYSEHQGGLAIDLWEATTNTDFLGKENLKSYYEWLMIHAASYGFHNSYQKGLAIDGYDIEPWHWRYLGEELASYLLQNNLTHTEFYNLES